MNTPLAMRFAGALALALASTSLAQTKAPVPAQPSDEPALKGPDVTDRPAVNKSGKPRKKAGFGGDAVSNGKPKPIAPLSMPAFIKSLAAVKLTPEQQSRVNTIAAEFESNAAKYLAEHKAEIDQLRGKLSADERASLDRMLSSGRPLKLSKTGFQGKRKAAKDAERPEGDEVITKPAPTPTDRADLTATRTRLLEIYTGRPKGRESQAQILALLTPEQTELMNSAPRAEKSPPAAPRQIKKRDAAPAKK